MRFCVLKLYYEMIVKAGTPAFSCSLEVIL